MEQLFQRFKTSPLEEYYAKFGKEQTSALKAMQVVGVMYGTGVSAMMYATLIFVVYPTVYAALPSEHTTMLWISFHIMLNLYYNYYLTYTTSSAYKPGLPTVTEDQSWKLCYDCSLKKPPRTHHCPLCQCCILKRDHHCFFTACCIGFRNQRYFITFNFYVSLGAAVVFYFCTQYLYLDYYPVMSAHFYKYILPIAFFEWLAGYMPFVVFHVVVVMTLAIMTSMGTGCFFLWQIFIIIRGQTTHEFWRGAAAPHKTSIFESFRSVFGPYWLLNFIFPMTFLKQTQDGIHWKDLKDI